MTDQMDATARTPAAVAEGLRLWLASGGIQSESGAYYAWVDSATGEPAFEYPEITGYALTWLAGRGEGLTEDEAEAGRRAAEWLGERIDANADRSARAGWEDQAVYNFDLGMISTGLLAFGKLRGEERWIDQGRRLASDIAAQVQPDGWLPSIPGGGTSPRSVWSTEGGAHVIKLVQCILAATDQGAEGLEQPARALAGSAAAIQQDDGRFVTHPSDRETMLHPHLYALEGLWCYGRATGDGEALERAARGVQWAFEHQLEGGGLPRYVETGSGERGVEQLDATSQAVRMAVLTDTRPAGLERAVARLTEAARGEGGVLSLPYQPTETPTHSNAWVSMFGAQALELAAAEAPALRWQLLV